jgi:hypothetical protein
MGVESYMHKYAKVVLAGWLRKKVRIGEKFKGLDNIILTLSNTPKTSPMCNVYSEYPICKDKNGNIIGLSMNDESQIQSQTQSQIQSQTQIQHPWEKWLHDNKRKVSAKHNVPTSYELKEYVDSKELSILHIFDLVYINPNTKSVESVFEIMHKHLVTEYKKKFIEENKLKGYEISAEWIMNKVQSPFHVECLNTYSLEK